MSISGIKAFRIVVKDANEFEKARDFYRQILGKDEKVAFGNATDIHQAAFFDVGGIDLIVTRETEATPEANIQQGPAWICFKADDPEKALADANKRGAKIENQVVDTSFGTRAFFVNDPSGLAVYVGTPWME